MTAVVNWEEDTPGSCQLSDAELPEQIVGPPGTIKLFTLRALAQSSPRGPISWCSAAMAFRPARMGGMLKRVVVGLAVVVGMFLLVLVLILLVDRIFGVGIIYRGKYI